MNRLAADLSISRGKCRETKAVQFLLFLEAFVNIVAKMHGEFFCIDKGVVYCAIVPYCVRIRIIISISLISAKMILNTQESRAVLQSTRLGSHAGNG
jgi:hypothetical protein